MSRAFVSENDAWEYCRKAGEHCMMAEKDKECTSQDCPHISKIVSSANKQSTEKRDKFVRVSRRK